jgi:hypothetical protein
MSFFLKVRKQHRDKKVRAIPRRPEKKHVSSMRQDMQRFVGSPDHSDIIITTSAYEQFQLIYLLGRQSEVL